MNLNGIKITWLGHATFLVVTPGGKTLILDPWLSANPATPADKKKIEKLDYMLISHGHSDHFADAVTWRRNTILKSQACMSCAPFCRRKAPSRLRP